MEPFPAAFFCFCEIWDNNYKRFQLLMLVKGSGWSVLRALILLLLAWDFLLYIHHLSWDHCCYLRVTLHAEGGLVLCDWLNVWPFVPLGLLNDHVQATAAAFLVYQCWHSLPLPDTHCATCGLKQPKWHYSTWHYDNGSLSKGAFELCVCASVIRLWL